MLPQHHKFDECLNLLYNTTKKRTRYADEKQWTMSKKAMLNAGVSEKLKCIREQKLDHSEALTYIQDASTYRKIQIILYHLSHDIPLYIVPFVLEPQIPLLVKSVAKMVYEKNMQTFQTMEQIQTLVGHTLFVILFLKGLFVRDSGDFTNYDFPTHRFKSEFPCMQSAAPEVDLQIKDVYNIVVESEKSCNEQDPDSLFCNEDI
jgi:hypothetical protein